MTSSISASPLNEQPAQRRRWPHCWPGLSDMWAQRLGIAARAAGAIGGGYLVAAWWSAALALMLPVARAEAVAWGLMLAFAFHACAALWMFAARTAWRAWGGLALAALPPAAALLLYRWGWLAQWSTAPMGASA